MTVELNRLPLTGLLDDETPICVIKEVASAHGVEFEEANMGRPAYVHRLINYVNQTPARSINRHPTSVSDWQKAAQFVNHSEAWPIIALRDAFDFLIGLIETSEITLAPNWEPGLQTQVYPRRINCSVLYGICRRAQVRTWSTMTMDQMATIVRMVTARDQETFHLQLRLVIGESSRSDVVNTVVSPLLHLGEKVSHDSLTSVYSLVSDPASVQSLIQPRTAAQAVALMALAGIDISSAENPIREYRHYQRNKAGYVPQDPELVAIYRLNPNLINLTKTFNPLFPPQYYSPHVLRNMVIAEGYDLSGDEVMRESHYNIMQLVYVTDTFYGGPQPNVTHQETPIFMEDISQSPPGSVFYYGQRVSGVRPILVTELTHLFRSDQAFTNPFTETRSVLSRRIVAKLKNLCRDGLYGTEVDRQRLTLIRAIEETEMFLLEMNDDTQQLMIKYRTGDEELKHQMERCFINFLNLSMYMRGWPGGSAPYPVAHAPVDNQNQVDLNVTEGIIAFERSCYAMGDIGRLVMRLPLMQYANGEFSVFNRDGRTVGERLEIVKSGVDTDNISSCIRISSNLFAVSAYRYMGLLGLPEPFSITQLRNIS